MSFSRHRNRTQETPKEEVKLERKFISPPKKETTPIEKKEKPKEEVKQEVKQELPVISKEEVKETPIVEVKKEEKPVIVSEIKKEEITPIVKKEKKQRVDTKEANLIGIVGKTVVANDFRAIVKKQGKQINDVLTEILHGWNMANYNL